MTTLKDIIREVEGNLIRKALEEAGDSKTKAAKILHMNRKALYRKIKMQSLGL